jgi:hypothetical protein
LLKKEKVEFGVGHARLTKDLEKLDKAHKALESEFSSLSKSHEQLKIRLTKYDVPSSSTPSCDHANVIEENTRLKAKLTKSFPSQGEKNLCDLLSNQRSNKGKEGLGYVSKTSRKKNKKNKNKKTNDVVARTEVFGPSTPESPVSPSRPESPVSGTGVSGLSAGRNNPCYELHKDHYGNVYAYYVGPYDGYIAWSIWVPKTLVTNKRGPIEKW